MKKLRHRLFSLYSRPWPRMLVSSSLSYLQVLSYFYKTSPLLTSCCSLRICKLYLLKESDFWKKFSIILLKQYYDHYNSLVPERTPLTCYISDNISSVCSSSLQQLDKPVSISEIIRINRFFSGGEPVTRYVICRYFIQNSAVLFKQLHWRPCYSIPLRSNFYFECCNFFDWIFLFWDNILVQIELSYRKPISIMRFSVNSFNEVEFD